VKKRWQGAGGYGEVLKIAVPLILSMGSWSLKHFVDRVFLTWYSEDALAAALPASMLSFAIGALFFGTVMYVNTFVAQYTGAGKPDRVGASVWQGIYFGVAAGTMMLGLIPAAPWIFDLAGHAPNVTRMEVSYFQILCTGWVPLLSMQALSCFFTGRGDTRTVMWVSMASAVANIALDYGLIFGNFGFPEWGIDGAGWGTVISQTFELLLYVALISKARFRTEFHTWSAWRYDGDLIRRILRFGTPSGVQFFLEVFGFTIFVMIVGRLGLVALAATNVTFNINTLAFLPMIGLGTAVSTLVGQYLGKDDPQVAVRVTWSAIHISAIYTGTMAALFVLVPDLFIYAFESGADPTTFPMIKEMSYVLLRFVAVYCVFEGVYIAFSSTVKGAGDTRFVMIVTLISSVSLVVVPVYVSVALLNMGVYVAWFFASVYTIIMSLLFYLRFRGGKWQTMRVIEAAHPPIIEPGTEPELHTVQP
jgi:multidrug resistance protein, MATE family